jgi:hypothetical protein
MIETLTPHPKPFSRKGRRGLSPEISTMNELFPLCDCLPLPDEQVSFRVAGKEITRWHFSSHYLRPFLYPFNGPSGTSLTRIGHPGAPDHDHHRSIWFAHAKLQGIDFWSENTKAHVKQKQWLCYEDGADEAVHAVLLGWFDGHDPKELMEQELIIAVRPLKNGESEIELQSTFRPTAATLTVEKSNFGFLAVRVAKHISAGFGGGELISSEGTTGEPAIFGKTARWMDYSGPNHLGGKEGITFFDHPKNPRHPTHWHVRTDGWMGASFCLKEEYILKKAEPLKLRYLLWAHQNGADAKRQEERFAAFENRPEFVLTKNPRKYTAWGAKRIS